MDEAVRIGLENNYDIRIAENEKEILENNYGYAKYSFLPGIGAVANRNFDVENTEQRRFNDSLPTIVNGAKSNQLSASVNLQWTIFDGLGMFIAYERLEALQEAGVLNLKAAIENNVAAISQAYYQIVLERERVNVLKNTLELSEKRLEIAKAIYEVGRSSKLEFLAAQVDLNTDVSALVSQEELLYQAKVNLNRIIGRQVDSEFTVTDSIDANKSLDIAALEKSLLINNPSLKVVATNKIASELQTKPNNK